MSNKKPHPSDREENIRWKQALFGEDPSAMTFYIPTPLAAIYVRVSTQDQAEGLSLQAQERRLLERVKEEGWDLRKDCIYHEVVSAEALIKRPMMLKALRDAEAKKFTVFLVVYQNRLARNTMDALLIAKQFSDAGVRIWVDDRNRFVDISGKTGLLEFTMMAGIDTYERMDIKDRMNMGREQARLSGRGWVGGPPPYGWKGEPIVPLPKKGPRYRLAIDEKEARIVREYMYGKPEWSDRRLTAFLNQEGIPTRTGKKWEPRAVRRIRTRRLYCGEYVYKGTVYQANDTPPIISKDAWLIMQGSLRRGDFIPDRETKHPLAGIAFCGHCGSKYYLAWQRNPKGRNPFGSYICSTRTRRYPQCPKSRTYSARMVHKKLIDNIKRRLNRPGFLEKGYETYAREQKDANPELSLLSTEAQMRELGEQKERLVDAIARGIITHKDATQKVLEIARWRKKYELRMEETLRKSERIPPLEEFKKVAERIEEAGPEELRAIVRALVQKVHFYGDSMSIFYRFWPRAIVKVVIRKR